MRTLARAVLIPLAVVAGVGGLAACGSTSKGSGGAATTAAAASSVPATTGGATSLPATTGAATSLPASTGAPTTAAPTTPAPTVSPTTSMPDQQVANGGTEIIVQVGTDDAKTLGSRVEPVALGSDVSLRLVDDQRAEQYHLHGYDLEQSVAAGVEAEFSFTADKPGRFELESHTTGNVLVVLEVR